ncbi:FAD-dependent oxidoreductase [Halorussus salinus]|uniref:FAD-dependent oxidoreductase n=1 Tax=Halorussus salinus TaxID=1364935 RepID=UPI001091ADC3|nr:FAD-dependent oxidoreductase [Halorussus salinus]
MGGASDDGTGANADEGSATDLLDETTVVVVGGGPAGCSAGVFTGRYGLDTTVFDRGNAALQRCAYLENYLGFPAGIDIDTFHELMHAHAEESGCDIVPETVVSVERDGEDGDDGDDDDNRDGDDESRFVVETQAGRRVRTEYVVVAAWYDGSYLRALGDDEMFEEHEHHGEVEERFDPEYADDDGRTPVDGLYVASPADARSAQAIVAAGNGAHVARHLIEDHRREQGYPEGVAAHYDWLRRDAEFSGEWADRDRWREWFENEVGDDYEVDDDRLADLRETYIDREFATRRTDEEVREQSERGLERLVEIVGTGRLLDAMDDETVAEYAAEAVDSRGE